MVCGGTTPNGATQVNLTGKGKFRRGSIAQIDVHCWAVPGILRNRPTNQGEIMKLKEYFATHAGVGVLATAGESGSLNAAIYSKPHFLEDGAVAFIMRDRLTHANMQYNQSACYLFVEDESKSKGVRLYLKKEGETDDLEIIQALSRRRKSALEDESKEPKFLVRFRCEKILPLIGDRQTDLEL